MLLFKNMYIFKLFFYMQFGVDFKLQKLNFKNE
jgi:hypothetical protein